MTSPCSVHIFGFPRRISLHPLDLAPFLEPLYFLVEFVQNLLHVLNIEQVFVLWAFDIASLGRQQSWVRPLVWSTPHGLWYIWTIISQSPCSAKWKLQKKRIRKRRNTCFILGHWNRLSLVVSLQEIRWISTSCILCGVGLLFTGFEGISLKISTRFCVQHQILIRGLIICCVFKLCHKDSHSLRSNPDWEWWVTQWIRGSKTFLLYLKKYIIPIIIKFFKII